MSDPIIATPVPTTTSPTRNALNARAIRIFAKTIFRELDKSGYSDREVLAVVTRVLELMTERIRDRRSPTTSSGSQRDWD
jgi:hypothetical protein